MTTRLDRLFILLDTGSTALIRKSAAEQLGQVQRLHPHELHNLLTKLYGYITSTTWETRIAAGQAIQAIVRNVPQWEPAGVSSQDRKDEVTAALSPREIFRKFDIKFVIDQGESLLGSEGREFDESTNANSDDKEVIAKQRILLNKRLGLDTGLGFMSSSLFSDDDLRRHSTPIPSPLPHKASASHVIKQQLSDCYPKMSSRERNVARRKAKLMARQQTKDTTSDADGEPSCKKMKRGTALIVSDLLDSPNNSSNAEIFNMDDSDEWPFENLCERLMNDMFSSVWETRHGAATALREIIRYQGKGAGRTTDTPSHLMSLVNESYLSDLALRLLSVLALDRFGDFISDEVVAPVRETCAQALGVVVRLLPREGGLDVTAVLLELLRQPQWEIRHSGLLGLKYSLAVRQDMTQEVLPLVLPSILTGLQDLDDDVRSVSAASLTSVTGCLTAYMPKQVPVIISCLWTTLLDLDDLTASTNCIMTLLCTLISDATFIIQDQLLKDLSKLVPRLFPFFTHNASSVRLSSLKTLCVLINNAQSQLWLPVVLTPCMRHVYQRALLESNADVLVYVEKVWLAVLDTTRITDLIPAVTDYLGTWFCLAMQHPVLPFDPNLLVHSKHLHKGTSNRESAEVPVQTPHLYIGGIAGISAAYTPEADHDITRARVTASRMLGQLCSTITKNTTEQQVVQPLDLIGRLHQFYLSSKSALQRFVAAQSLLTWASSEKTCLRDESLKKSLTDCLTENLFFDEIASSFARMQSECGDFIAFLKQSGVNMDQHIAPNAILSMAQAMALTTSLFSDIQSQIAPMHRDKVEECRRQLHAVVSQVNSEQLSYTIRIQMSLAGAVTALDCLPSKLNPVVRPLMDAIRKENNGILQKQAAASLCVLMETCVDRIPSPNAKIIKNLCCSLCSDPTFTPPLQIAPMGEAVDDLDIEAESSKARRPGPKRIQIAVDAPLELPPDPVNDVTVKNAALERRGASIALTLQALRFSEDLPAKLPTLWQYMTHPLDLVSQPPPQSNGDHDDDSEASLRVELIQSLQLVETLMPSLHADLSKQILDYLPTLATCLENNYTSIRHLSSRAIAAICRIHTVETMTYLIEKLLPSLGATENEIRRQGASEAIAQVIEVLGVDMVPYLVMFVVPVMGSMSDQNTAVRLMATQCFATLVTLMPLEQGADSPAGMKASLIQQRREERHFLEQLLDSSKVDDFKIPVKVNAELRRYQQDGVNWLAFLQKYKLHGILCDDMGLGKTLMSICILASDHHDRRVLYQLEERADCTPIPSLVICPPTLTGHWIHEINKFVSPDVLSPLHYTGPPIERQRLRSVAHQYNLLVVSYELIRNDIEFFLSMKWNYCILDEGHVIKNSKTKMTKAIKQLVANHRLILSGTPIQNNVLDLWSLFDFLMPGFLGSERGFQARYGRPILQSRDAKSDSKDQEAGVLAMESLHRQVLPFILRRLKQDVLHDLPPKIIQDYYCDMSPLQVRLYEDFAQSQASKVIQDSVALSASDEQTGMHVFQALQYLRKVCNHPVMVLTQKHPKYAEIMATVDAKSLHDIQHAPKLIALKQLLLDCGIGVAGDSSGQLVDDAPVVNQHRVLVFCQLQSMLDIVEKDLLRIHLPTVTYLRLDGRVPAADRHSLVHRFNNDPSIDLLLLTTHIGGMGLNLTGADTVIFVEHDWNPMKDLQAMDRAHRIGQKRVVNVYRLVTRGTLEDKIMGLQKFKMTVANTVISADNSSLATMGTNQLLDLFSLDGDKASTNQQPRNSDNAKQSMKSVLENLDELWEATLYEEEYNLDAFMQSLHN